MSWSKQLLRNGFLAIAIVLGGTLSACTMAPVYSDPQAVSQRLAFTYAEPNSRLEQIVYQELRLRFGVSEAPDARQVRVSVSASGPRQGLSATPNPNTLRRMTATARLTILPPAGSTQPPVTITRTATADFTTNAQAFAARESVIEAQERATRAAAESLRLALLAGAVR
ncbi:hypothetical protein VE25_00125 [Devosia geojensis]|uniref:LPS-assembly lipoprotein n=1 Tax=Devosia geojensis TaxID=443610 RepID=A0A0F5FY33_9HYPH|nr:hypothetical protein [Devosia geojensis]KKB13769.1 hypothetical protein VE25_00125 [Devosia geojensis]